MKPINEPVAIFALRRKPILCLRLWRTLAVSAFGMVCWALIIYLTVIVVLAIQTPGNVFRLVWENFMGAISGR